MTVTAMPSRKHRVKPDPLHRLDDPSVCVDDDWERPAVAPVAVAVLGALVLAVAVLTALVLLSAKLSS